ncbi:HEAT repeat domain-containing protein [Methylocaldum sp. MU1018]
MTPGRFRMAGSLLLWPGLLLAAGGGSNPSEQNVQVITTGEAGVELQLEVRQAPLAQVFNELSKKTGVRINHSVLPDGLVTATCVGATVEPVIECLLDHKASLVARYAKSSSNDRSQRQPAEVWILGTTFGTRSASPSSQADCSAASEPDETDALVKMAKSDDPAERAEAVGRLLAGGRKGDMTVRDTLRTALSDEDARVRMQAISSFARREGAGAAAALQEAMHDSEVSVRLAAVNSAGDDIALLQQALEDSDESVRQLAKIKLESLSKGNSTQW